MNDLFLRMFLTFTGSSDIVRFVGVYVELKTPQQPNLSKFFKKVDWNLMNVTDVQLRQYIDQIFSRYDRDGTGSLDVNELAAFFNEVFQRMGSPVNVTQQQAVQALQFIDKNFDRKASKQELFSALKMLSGGQSQGGSGQPGYGGQGTYGATQPGYGGVPGQGGQGTYGATQPGYGMPGQGGQGTYGATQPGYGMPGQGGQGTYGATQPGYGMPGQGGQGTYGATQPGYGGMPGQGGQGTYGATQPGYGGVPGQGGQGTWGATQPGQGGQGVPGQGGQGAWGQPQQKW